MPSTQAITTTSTLQRIRAVLESIDTLHLPSPLRPMVETIIVQHASRMMDRALPWQEGHGRRTSILARRIGACVELSDESLHQLALAALLHDIGLLALPSALMTDTGCLDVQSYAARQSHPRVGAEWLQPYQYLRSASVIIAHHHERWDGSGYPYGIRGTFIPIEARILAIADAIDAVCISRIPGVMDQTARADAASRILTAGAGTQFDPQLVDLCGQCLQRLNLILPLN